MTAGWDAGNLNAALVWRQIGPVTDDDDTANFAVERIAARDYLDAQLALTFADVLGLSFGVKNLTDETAPILGDNQQQSNTWPATYDVFGRTYFVRLTGRAR